MKELNASIKEGERSLVESATHHALTTTVTLDAFAEQRGWFDTDKHKDLSIPILKLDVEGKEPMIIEGAQKLLRSGIVKNVLTSRQVKSRERRTDENKAAWRFAALRFACFRSSWN